MVYVKVHEWCFACVGWLDLCYGNDVHPCMHLQLCLEIGIISVELVFLYWVPSMMAFDGLNVMFRLLLLFVWVIIGEP